jgi:hypothetical protein
MSRTKVATFATWNPMELTASELVARIHPDATSVSVRARDGGPFREVSIEELQCLVDRAFVIGICRGQKLRQIQLTVPPDVASRELCRTRRRLKDVLHSDASQTTLRSLENLPKFRRRHHQGRCLAWSNERHARSSTPGRSVEVTAALTPSEEVNSGRPLRPPVRR